MEQEGWDSGSLKYLLKTMWAKFIQQTSWSCHSQSAQYPMSKRSAKRQAGTWDPLLQRLPLDKRLTEQKKKKKKKQRNYKGLKITVKACTPSWGKLWTTRDKKTKKTQLPLLRSQEKKQDVEIKSWVLCMSPEHNTTKGMGRPPKPPLWPNHESAPTSPH